MTDRCAVFIDQVLNKEHSEAEWCELQKQFNSLVATGSKEELCALDESGIGEMLYMICAGIGLDQLSKF